MKLPHQKIGVSKFSPPAKSQPNTFIPPTGDSQVHLPTASTQPGSKFISPSSVPTFFPPAKQQVQAPSPSIHKTTKSITPDHPPAPRITYIPPFQATAKHKCIHQQPASTTHFPQAQTQATTSCKEGDRVGEEEQKPGSQEEKSSRTPRQPRREGRQAQELHHHQQVKKQPGSQGPRSKGGSDNGVEPLTATGTPSDRQGGGREHQINRRCNLLPYFPIPAEVAQSSPPTHQHISPSEIQLWSQHIPA